MPSSHHGRVAPGSLVLLCDSPTKDVSNRIDPTLWATSQARAMARLKMGNSVVVHAGPTQARAIIDYAESFARPVVAVGDETNARAYAPNARAISAEDMTLLSYDLTNVTSPIVIFGDLHQCWRSYEDLKKAAYEKLGEGVLFVSAGDLFDKGGSTPSDVVRTAEVVMEDFANGDLIAVKGNHDVTLCRRLTRALTGVFDPVENEIRLDTKMPHRTPRALLDAGDTLALRTMRWLQAQPLFVRASSSTVVVHAAWDPDMASTSPSSRLFEETCLFGPRPPKGQPRFDSTGKAVWIDWAQTYEGSDQVVHGHTGYDEPRIVGNVINVDTRCVEGNHLTGYVLGTIPDEPGSFISVPLNERDRPLPTRSLTHVA